MSYETSTASLSMRPKTSEMLPNNYETLPFPTIFDSPQDRIQFLNHIYASGECNRYAELANGTSVPRGVFELPRDVFQDYITAATDMSPRPQLPYKIRLEEFFAARSPDTPGLDEQRAYARQVSVSGEKVKGLAIDPLKIERFGLQRHFIRKQQELLFGQASNVEATPLAQRLRQLSEVRDGKQDGIGLADDISQAFDEASEVLIDHYQTNREPSEGYGGLTEEQKFALRYKEVAKMTEDLRLLGRYISPLDYGNDATAAMITESVPLDIWGVSNGGAGLPMVIPGLVDYIRGLSMQDREINPKAFELKQLALERSNEIGAVALQQASDFVASLSGHFYQALRESSLYRDGGSGLKLTGTVRPRFAGLNSYYPATDLGCPAIRERNTSVSTIPNKSKDAHFIDNLLAVAVYEADRRGSLVSQ